MIRSAVLACALCLGIGCAQSKRAEFVGLHAPGSLGPEGAMRWIGADVARAVGEGAGAPLLLGEGAGVPGDNLGGRAAVPGDQCALFLARGSPSVEDLDLFVYGEDGTVLASDETSSARASALICPPHPMHVYGFGRIAAGRGLFAVSAQLVAQKDADRAARAVGALGSQHEEAIAASGWPGLDEAVALHRRDLGGVWHDARRVAVPMDPRTATRVTAAVEAHQCTDLFVLPSDDVAFVELDVLDPDGRILGRAPSETASPAVVVCAQSRTTLTYELRPRAGRGLAAVITSVTQDPKSFHAEGTIFFADALTPPSLDEGSHALAERLARAGYAAPLKAKRSATNLGERASVDLSFPDGCSRVDVLVGAPAKGVDAWLWSEAGGLLAHDDGISNATLYACGAGAKARLDVEALTRAGPFAVETRAAPDAPKLFSHHPVAAARVLERLTSAGRIASPHEILSPKAFSLGPAALTTGEEVVPLGSCLDVALGIGTGAEGVELRLANADTGSELALARGRFAALSDACATDGSEPLRLHIEMRVSAGTSDALLAVHARPLPPPAPAKVTSPPLAR